MEKLRESQMEKFGSAQRSMIESDIPYNCVPQSEKNNHSIEGVMYKKFNNYERSRSVSPFQHSNPNPNHSSSTIPSAENSLLKPDSSLIRSKF